MLEAGNAGLWSCWGKEQISWAPWLGPGGSFQAAVQEGRIKIEPNYVCELSIQSTDLGRLRCPEIVGQSTR